MRFRLGLLALMVAGAASVGMLVPGALASHAVKARAARQAQVTLLHTCYPGNSFAVDPGNFRVAASGSGTGTYEIENTGTVDGSVAVLAQYSFTGVVLANNGPPFVANGGQMNGTFSVSISYPGSLLPPTSFKPACIAELQTDPGDGTGSFEAEIEGIVSGFPGSTGPERAIASVHSERDTVGLTFGVSIELGKTCAELPQFPNETEVGGPIGGEAGGLISGSLQTPVNQTAGRGALPYGVTPDFDPGAPCDGSASF